MPVTPYGVVVPASMAAQKAALAPLMQQMAAGPPGMSAMGAAPAASPAPYAPAPQPPGMDPLQRLMAARNRVFAGQMPMIGPRERAALAMTGGRRA